MDPDPHPTGQSRILGRNLAMLRNRERMEREQRRPLQRLFGRLIAAASETWFMGLHALWFSSWILINSGVIPVLPRFDPFPFSFLTFVVSLEAIFLSLAILMTQALENRQTEDRNNLDLQVNLLAEREATKTLELLRAICEKLGIQVSDDAELNDLLRPTQPDSVLDELGKQREDQEAPDGTGAKTGATN